MTEKKLLKVIEVNQDIWNKIIYDYEKDLKQVNNLHDYYWGYKDKANIYICKEELICREYILNYYTNCIEECTNWKQIRVRLNEAAETKIIDSLNGPQAKAYIMKILHKYYSDEEIDKCLKAHEADYDPNKIQVHYDYLAPEDEIVKIENCYYYDINGAHLDALCEIFPRATKNLTNMYKLRKKKPIYKKYPNFFVGMLAQKQSENKKAQLKARALGATNTEYDAKYEKTYNWIVQRTTEILMKAISYVGGNLAYANTDGFIVYDNTNKLNTSKLLGDFKCEWNGTLYIYKDKNYLLYQMDETKKGSMLNEVRDQVDLRKCEVIHYDIKKSKYNTKYADNIIKEIKNG